MMRIRMRGAVALLVLLVGAAQGGTRVTLDENGVMNVDGKKIFMLSTSLPPLPDQKSPEGKMGLAQLKEDGLNFCRIRPVVGMDRFDEEGIRTIKPWLDAAAAQGLYCWVTLGKIPTLPKDKPL